MNEGIYWPSFFFLLFAASASLFALAVVFASNIVRMAFYLVLSLGSTAGLFFLAGADFVAAMQLMIYVGGTLVLLIFGVMLTSQAQFVSMKTRSGEWILAAIVGGSLLAVLVQAAFSHGEWGALTRAEAEAVVAAPNATPIGGSLTAYRPDVVNEPDAVRAEGRAVYLLIFEIVSVHLLVVLVGAAYLARARRRRDTPLGATA